MTGSALLRKTAALFSKPSVPLPFWLKLNLSQAGKGFGSSLFFPTLSSLQTWLYILGSGPRARFGMFRFADFHFGAQYPPAGALHFLLNLHASRPKATAYAPVTSDEEEKIKPEPGGARAGLARRRPEGLTGAAKMAGQDGTKMGGLGPAATGGVQHPKAKRAGSQDIAWTGTDRSGFVLGRRRTVPSDTTMAAPAEKLDNKSPEEVS